MDLQELKNNYPILISYMESRQYSRQYIKHIKNESLWILRESENYSWKTYDDIYQTCIERYTNKYTLRYKYRMLLVIKRFILENVLPDGSRHAHKPSYYDSLCAEYKHFIDTYRLAIKSKHTKSFHYYKSYECSACSFLSRLQKQGVFSLEHITEKNVMDVFANDDKLCGSYHFKIDNAFVFRECAPFYPEGMCTRIITYFPDVRKARKNIQYLTKSEAKKIKLVLDDGGILSLQDRAIGLLAFYTGLRSCDIAALTFDQIDWENDLIRIVQQKTGTPLFLPLRPIVGNAIFDYITHGRPKLLEETVFLTVNVPHKRLQSPNLYAICANIMKTADIRKYPGDVKGFHLFRHHLATSLLEKGIETPVISRTLGHCSQESLDIYLKADFIHLKECALSISNFPVRKEVFYGF